MPYSTYHKRRIHDRPLHPETQMMSFGYDPFLSEGAVKPPVFLTSTFAFPSAEAGAEFFDVAAGRKPLPADGSAGLVYSRFNHPNLEIVEDRLAVLDGSEAALVTASGMAAISTSLLALVRPGDQIVQTDPLYGGTETLVDRFLAAWGVRSHVIEDALAEESIGACLERAAAQGPVRVCYLETPANPTNALVDLAAVRRALDVFAARHGERPVAVCDNTMLGPIFQQPAAHGIDLSVYSLTKYVGGHSDLVAGGITGSRELVARIRAVRGTLGTQLDPHSSWMLTRSMETLVLRMRRAAATGTAAARWLAAQGVRVLHPELSTDPTYQAVYRRQCSGPGSTFAIELAGGRAAAFRFINALALFRRAVSLGGTESLVCHPASTTHSGVPAEVRDKTGVSEGLVRISIGLEHEEDLIEDLRGALAAI